ncbi:uncharacterized protein LOC110378307 [Helicoverpa armigera]|uniref:uncharacterized protein LOC110378307 n=1 Tax=Helicoverpa armigera TaxID=29058 RepID=UPI003083D13C
MMSFTHIAVFSCFVFFCVGLNSDCGSNEVFQCVQPCPPEKSCNNRDIGISCTQEIRPCVFTCVCKPGLIRNDKNECVTEDQCENCTRENEEYDCGELCDNVCATLSERNRTHCDLWNHRCVRKCFCKDGFARDDKWQCVPIDECPEPPKDENY